MDIIENRYKMIIESERSGKSISDICIAFGVSRETWYKWNRRYDIYGLDGLKNQSKRPHNIKYKGNQRTGKDYSQTETK
jgi:transposase